MGSTAGLSLLNAFAPVELLNPIHFGQSNSNQALALTPAQRVYSRASSAVVTVIGGSSGSGSIIDSDGLVLTNWHVVQDSQNIQITMVDGRKLSGAVVSSDQETDLAIVQIQGGGNFPTIEMADPDSISIGQDVYAIGNPYQKFEGTLTTGIVSRIDSEGLIQTDTSINVGNSGGPLLNRRGELIGVISSFYNPKNEAVNLGIAFAIPVAQVQAFLATAQDAPPEPEIQRVALNAAPIQGELTSRSNVLTEDNSYFVPYSFEGRAGQQVTIEMTSSEIDPYLILLSSNGADLAQDDDSGGGSNSRIVVTLPADQTYLLLANSAPGETGRYSLQIATASSPEQATVLLQEQGTLGPDSPVLESDNSFYQEHSFQGEAGQIITVSLESSDFDTYLLLYDANNQLVGENDDASAETLNSSLTVTLPTSGTYRIFANAYDSSGQGSYRLVVR